MRREAWPWILIMVGALCLVAGFFAKRHIAIIGFAFIVVGAVLYLTSRHRGAESIPGGAELGAAEVVSRPGLRDRYEGIMTALTRW